MKTAIITLAAALMLGTSLGASAQAQDPNDPIIIPDQQGEQPVKKKKRKQVEQPEQSAPQAEGEQSEQPVKKRKKRAEQAEQPVQEQYEQPVKKRKKQAEQPEDFGQQPVGEQVEQPIKKRKKQQAEQPDLGQEPVGEQVEQPFKKKKKQQAEEPGQQPAEGQAEQSEPVKKKKPRTETSEQPADQTQQPSQQTTGEPQPGQSETAGTSPEVSQYLSDTRSPKELSDEELRQRAKAGRDLSRMKGLPDDVRRKLAAEGRKARAEALARGSGESKQQTTEPPPLEQPSTGEATKSDQIPPPQGEGQPTQPMDQATQQTNPDKKQVQRLDGNKSSPEAESKAKTYLDDTRQADQLNDDQLRDRLEGMRELMGRNQLSGDSERALRRKLRAERAILRNRVAEKVVVEEDKGDVIPGRKLRRDRDDRKWDNWSERDVLRDRRRSQDLEEGELRRRIDIYRIAIYDDRYDDEERAYWRGMMDRDRLYLRDRLISDRRERERYWHDRRDRNEIDIAINIDLGDDYEPRDAVFMDEIDDEELETYLVAAPRRKIDRRYTIEEIEEEPELRTAMPAIEIDNIHFGFNESFVREEEVDKLDRVAEVIEKILAAHPGEVFMIAGHTDAVGSDDYNLNLSRERAEAVKKALTSYYVIPARNLKTVGYGERYLKIPTAEQEEENRRVSLQRVTPLVGEADEAAEVE